MTNTLSRVNELELFNKTIREIQELKILGHTSSEWAGKDFSLDVNTNLLYPSFYIYEVYGGEKLVEEIIFDRHTQSFHIRQTGDQLTNEKLIQHINRSLIPWVTGLGFESFTPAELSQLRYEIHSMGNPELSKTTDDVVALMEVGNLLPLDHAIELYHANTEDEYDEINSKFAVMYDDYKCQNGILEEKLIELSKEFKVDGGFVGKLMRLLWK